MTKGDHKPDITIFVAGIGLVVLGLVIVFSASYSRGMFDYGDPHFFIRKQLISAVLGTVIMIFLMRLNYRLLRPFALPMMVLSFILLIVVLLLGDSVRDSRSIDLGFTTFQPAELAKLSLVNFMAAYVAYKKQDMRKFWNGLFPALVVMGLVFGLILLQPDFGTGLALAGTAALMLFASGVNLTHFFLVGLSALPAMVYLAVAESYRFRRLTAFINPWSDPLDSGWNIIQSLLALGSGGVFGLGLGLGRQKYAYLPEQHTDFIFSVAGEEFGLVGTLIIVLLFFMIVWRGCRIAMKAPDVYGSMLAIGLTAMIGLQAALNMGVASGVFPVTGVTLPLISYGGTSLMVSMAALGVLLNISSHIKETE